MKHSIFFLILFFATHTWCQESSPTFVQGLQDYEAKNYEKAKEVFRELDKTHPDNPAILLNLGLSHYQLGQKGLALGLWRKARFFQPNLEGIDNAISFAESELIQGQSSDTVFSTINKWLRKFSSTFWMALSFLLFIIIGWSAVTLFAKRKTPFSEWPYWLYAALPIWIVCISFSLWYHFDSSKLRATVIQSDTLTHAGPSESSPSLSTLQEGLSVEVLKNHKEWRQVLTPTGNTGWVSASDLIIAERQSQ